MRAPRQVRTCLLSALLCLGGCASDQGVITKASGVQALDATATRFIREMQGSNFADAAALFHLPATYSVEERLRERWEAEEALRIIGEALGSPATVRLTTSPIPDVSGIDLTAADPIYWQTFLGSHDPRFVGGIYEVEFTKAGTGYLSLYLFNVGHGWELAEAKFALPSSRPGAIELMTEISIALRDLIYPRG